MADSYVNVLESTDPTAKQVDNEQTTTGAGTVYRQRVAVPDGADAAQGATTDLSSGNTVIGLLKNLKAALAGTLTVAGTVARSWTLSSATDSVNVGNFPATQAVSGTVTANQGGTWTVQPGNTANTTAWKVDGSAVTQPVSGTVTANQGGIWTVQPGNTANTTAWKVDGSAVTQPVSIAGTVAENVTQVGGVAVAATAKGTQGTNFVPTQDAIDTGRTAVVLYLDAATGITVEALGTMGITKGGVAQTAATSYTVTAGKTFRISGLHTTVKNTSTVASDSRVRVRQAASAISVTSPIILLNEAGSPAAVAQAAGTDDTVMPDGYEVAGGQQVAISHIESATTCTISVVLVGFEY